MVWNLIIGSFIGLSTSCSSTTDPIFKSEKIESSSLFRVSRISTPIKNAFKQFRQYSQHKKNLGLLRNHDSNMLQKDLHQFIQIRSDYYQKFNGPPLGGTPHISAWQQIKSDKPNTYSHITYSKENFSPFLKLIYNNFLEIESKVNAKFPNQTTKEYIINRYIIHFRLAEKIRNIGAIIPNDLSADEQKIIKEAQLFSLSPKKQFPSLFLSSNVYVIELMERYKPSSLSITKDFDFNKIENLIEDTINELNTYSFMNDME